MLGKQDDSTDLQLRTLMQGCVGISTNEVHPVNAAIEYAHGDCEYGFYPDWSRAAEPKLDIQTGPFDYLSFQRRMLATRLSMGLESLSITGLAFFRTYRICWCCIAVRHHAWWSGWLHKDVEDDNCPLVTNPDQGDNDFDGRGDAYDPDDDNDGVEDRDDAFPFDAAEAFDSDGDGQGNNSDTDDDNDNIADIDDVRPLVAACPMGTTEVSIDRVFDSLYGHWEDEGIDKGAVALTAPALCQLPARDIRGSNAGCAFVLPYIWPCGGG